MVGGDPSRGNWGGAILVAVVQQVLALILCGMISTPVLAVIWLYAFCAFWVGVGVIAIRRKRSPTSLDLALVRIGFWPLWLVAMYLAGFVWHVRGR